MSDTVVMRPARFADMVGRDALRSRLQRSLRTGRISHAYIIEGEDRSGKHFISGLFSRSLVCERLSEDAATGLMEPCGSCSACVRALAGTHPDVLTITHDKESSISVDEIRAQLVGQSQIASYEGGRRVYIVPDSDLMTVPAQNALLKTLEEPTEGVTILLLSRSADSLLPTITSRCVRLSLRPIGEDVLADFLMRDRHVVDYRARVAAVMSQGNIGRAIDLSEGDGLERYCETVAALLIALPELTTTTMLERVRPLMENGVGQLMDVCAWLIRDALVISTAGSGAGEHLILTSQVAYSRRMGEKLSPAELKDLLESTEAVRGQVAANVAGELSVELFLLEIRDRLS